MASAVSRLSSRAPAFCSATRSGCCGGGTGGCSGGCGGDTGEDSAESASGDAAAAAGENIDPAPSFPPGARLAATLDSA